MKPSPIRLGSSWKFVAFLLGWKGGARERVKTPLSWIFKIVQGGRVLLVKVGTWRVLEHTFTSS